MCALCTKEKKVDINVHNPSTYNPRSSVICKQFDTEIETQDTNKNSQKHIAVVD